jgi:hypothetical protein
MNPDGNHAHIRFMYNRNLKSGDTNCRYDADRLTRNQGLERCSLRYGHKSSDWYRGATAKPPSITNVKGPLFLTQPKHHPQLQLLRFSFKSNYFQTSKCSSPRSSSLLPLLLALWACQLVRNKPITISLSTILIISLVANIEALAVREPEPHLTDANVEDVDSCKRDSDIYYQTGCWMNGFLFEMVVEIVEAAEVGDGEI